MNMLLGIMALVSIFVQVTAKVETADQLKADLPNGNRERKEFCRNSGLPEPEDLTWDDRLASLAASATGSCENRDPGPNQLTYVFGGDENANKLKSFFNKRMKDLIVDPANRGTRLKEVKKYLRQFPWNVQMFNPDQTSIGCADNPCTGTIPPNVPTEAGTSGNSFSFKVYCILEPAGEWPDEVVQKFIDDVDAGRNGGSATQNPNVGGQAPMGVGVTEPVTQNPNIRRQPPNSARQDPNIAGQDPSVVVPNESGGSAKTDAPNSSRFASSINTLLLAFLMVPIINIFL